MSTMLKIGELASKSGLSRDTIRFYEREALLPQPQRTPAGYRLYNPDVVARLLFIKQAQALGFSLTEIRDLLNGCHDASECRRVASLISQKIAELDQTVREIQTLRSTLSIYLTDGGRSTVRRTTSNSALRAARARSVPDINPS